MIDIPDLVTAYSGGVSCGMVLCLAAWACNMIFKSFKLFTKGG